MRHLILIALVCTTSLAISNVAAQAVDPVHAEKELQSYLGNFEKDDKRKFYIQEVVQSDDATKYQLFIALSTWVSEHFESADSAIEMEDIEGGLLIARGWTSAGIGADGSSARMYHSVKFEIRDGKYRFRIFDVEFDSHISADPSSGTGTLTDVVNAAYDESGQIEVGAKYTLASEALQSLLDTKETLMHLEIEAANSYAKK